MRVRVPVCDLACLTLAPAYPAVRCPLTAKGSASSCAPAPAAAAAAPAPAPGAPAPAPAAATAAPAAATPAAPPSAAPPVAVSSHRPALHSRSSSTARRSSGRSAPSATAAGQARRCSRDRPGATAREPIWRMEQGRMRVTISDAAKRVAVARGCKWVCAPGLPCRTRRPGKVQTLMRTPGAVGGVHMRSASTALTPTPGNPAPRQAGCWHAGLLASLLNP